MTNMTMRMHRMMLLALLLLAGRTAMAQHGHLNVGALGTAQGDALYFANGGLFAESSGYIRQMTPTLTGSRAGFYSGSFTLTALPATVANGGPSAGASALGSFIQYGIVSVTGPEGGQFGFWESGATSPTLSFASGHASGSPTMIPLSDVLSGAGTVGGDPYGHLHGRAFTATATGEYMVGFQAFDTSSNGVDGAPIHVPSEVLTVRFVAVPEPGLMALVLSGVPVLGWSLWRRRKA